MKRQIHLAKYGNALHLLLCMGPSWALFRFGYAIRQKCGLLQRRMPAYTWKERPLKVWLESGIPSDQDDYFAWRKENAGCFFFPDLRNISPHLRSSVLKFFKNVTEEADKLLSGYWRYFSHPSFQIGFPPNWHCNPVTGEIAPAKAHWSRISDFGHGDIKFIWEPSRFSAVYILVRAYAANGDERYPEAFWRLVEDWAEKNPPNLGPNWKCGQECALRIMAWSFGLYAFAKSQHTTPDRMAQLVSMIAAHAERIEGNIAYARSQKNNHAITEAVGLWTVGLLFPELKYSARWRQHGRKVLENEVCRQIYDDGSYIQHSMNYHRLMLHALLWAFRLGKIAGKPFPHAVRDRFDRAIQFLYQLCDTQSGRVPNYGANDGALILPLNNCDYLDFRPVLQAAHYLIHNTRLFPPGPWDEDLLWLFGPEALDSPIKPLQKEAVAADSGGYYTLLGKGSWGMVRCHSYRDRPSQADMLHFDLWFDGKNILRDGGSYSYNCEPPWKHYFISTSAHNTVEVDGKDQMEKGPRFLWLRWTRSRVRQNTILANGKAHYWEGEHFGYSRRKNGVVHQRGILVAGDALIIVDDLLSSGAHKYTLRWRLINGDWRLISPHTWYNVQSEAKISVLSPATIESRLVNGQKKTSPEGWESLYYGEKVPCPTIICDTKGDVCRFITVISFHGEEIGFHDERVIKLNDLEVRLNPQSNSNESIVAL
jgi:asparagine synthase (glutamine-hydrolysing)